MNSASRPSTRLSGLTAAMLLKVEMEKGGFYASRSTSVMALGPNLIFGRPPVILPVKRHPCART
jgi:hypothetical protein|eukprot:COSAG03_NODE_416_length_8086_cov_5.782772_13_plen_64_part_00